MKKTLTIIAFALVLLLCCVSCGSKEFTVTLDVDSWNAVAKAAGKPELKLIGGNTLTCKKGEAVNVPKVMRNGVEYEVNWTIKEFKNISDVAVNDITVLTGAVNGQIYKPTGSCVLYAYDN